MSATKTLFWNCIFDSSNSYSTITKLLILPLFHYFVYIYNHKHHRLLG